MDDVAADDPAPVEDLARYQQAGRAWVAEESGRVVAYLVLEVLGDAAHVEQVSVDPRYARRRIGARLIGTAAQWARGHGLRELTLTTFEDVPWNAPYYRRLGFEALDDAEQSADIRQVRDRERARGLDRWLRVAMRRRLDPAGNERRLVGWLADRERPAPPRPDGAREGRVSPRR